MNKVVVTGAAGELGARVVAQLFAAQYQVRAVDEAALMALPAEVATKQANLEIADLESLFRGADSVVHLSSRSTPGQTDVVADELDLLIAKRVLEAAADCQVGQVVLLSTALVYGAQLDNPLPLSEDASLRPNPDFFWAVGRANIEKMAASWRRSPNAVPAANDSSASSARPTAPHMGKDARQIPAIAILRPTAIVSNDDLGQLARVLHVARLGIATDADAALQYLHIDDLVSAVVTTVLYGVDGALNVAPDGWTSADALRDLEGSKPRLRLPLWVARVGIALRLGAGAEPIPPGVVPYTTCSWVIANDRLRDLGWVPTYSNEEAWVVSHALSPLDRVPASRRQQLALAIAALAVLSGFGFLWWLLRRISKVRVGDA